MVDLGSFHCKKWTLFTFALIGLVLTIIVTIVACAAIGHTTPPDGSSQEVIKNWPEAQRIAKGLVIGVGVISCLFYLLGLCGAYKEHYCMTLTFAILMTLATLSSIGPATRPGGGSYWGSFVINLLITILAYLLANDIKVLQRSGGNAYTA